MIRLALALAVPLLAACAGPGLDLAAAIDPERAQRRGAVEVIVKSAYPGILAEVEAGGGPALVRAFDAAGVPAADRPARLLQLRGDLPLYEANPGALVAALALYGA